MTRTHAIVRLLQHGPLSLRDIVLIGGAGWRDVDVLADLHELATLGCIASHRYECYQLAMEPDEALRRLRPCDRPGHAPARVAPVQPGVSGVRRSDDLLPAPHDLVVSERTRRAHDPYRRGVGRAGTRRAAAARRGSARLEAVGGVGA